MNYNADTVLIDLDMMCYLSSDPDEPALYVLHSVKLMIEDIIKKTGAKNMRGFLSSSTNFRYDVDPDYKIGRRDTPKPPHYETTKNYLKKYFNAEVSPDGLEADDYIAQIQNNSFVASDRIRSTCIASLDKDFLTVSGLHYKWRNHGAGEVFYVSEEDAEAYLCYQLLIGDKADSIISPLKKYKADGSLGKVGFGHVAARDFLLQYDYEDMRDAVYDEYCKQDWPDKFRVNYELLAIGRVKV